MPCLPECGLCFFLLYQLWHISWKEGKTWMVDLVKVFFFFFFLNRDIGLWQKPNVFIIIFKASLMVDCKFRISNAQPNIFPWLTSTLLFIMNLTSISAATEKGSKFVFFFFFPFIHIKISDSILMLDKLWRWHDWGVGGGKVCLFM